MGFLVVGVGGALVLGGSSDPAPSFSASMPAIVVPGTSATPGMSEPGPSSPSPTTAIRPIGLPGASETPAATIPPAATVAPAATIPPPVAPVATPRPLGYGTLSYSATACFEVDWKDAKGRQISGAEARYAITIKNPTGARTRNLWIGVQTTDQFTTDPLISRASWARRPKAYGDETSLVIAGPRLDTGATRLKWRVFYQTPIDVHTRVWIAEGPNPAKGVMTIEEIEAASAYVWDVKTNVKVCR
jgi:hypothetical protein